MDRPTRTLLMASTSVAVALSLTFASGAAHDDETTSEEMASMAPDEGMEPGLLVKDPWTRESPMVDLAGAAYMVIRNSTDADDALVAVSSPIAESVELHRSAMDDEGMMSMNQVTEVPIPAHAEAFLEPGGYHVMLIGLSEPLVEGVEVELELEFLRAEPQTVLAPVMAGAPMSGDMGPDEMGHDEMGHDEMGEGDDAAGPEEDEG